MVDLIDTVQELNIDDSFIELFDVKLKWIDSSGTKQTETVHLINGLEDGTLNLWMPYDNGTSIVFAQYLAVPIEISGIAMSSDGPQGRPTLSVANVASLARTISTYNSQTPDNDGTDNEVAFSGQVTNPSVDSILENLEITKNEDILGSLVTYRKTLRKNTYVKIAGNFYSYDDRQTIISGVPTPKEFPEGKFVLDRVAGETSFLVQFELASPFDIQGLKIPNRYVIGKYCPWDYKGAVNTDGSIKPSVKSGCTWNNNGIKTVSTTQAPSGSTDGTYTIKINDTDVTYTGNGIAWELTFTLASDSVTNLVVERPGYGADTSDTIRVSTNLIGGSSDLILSPTSRVNFNVDDAATNSAGDVCGKTIESCKKRFHFGAKEKNLPLPFGGFPGSRKFR